MMILYRLTDIVRVGAEPYSPDQTRTFKHALFLYRGHTRTALKYPRRFFSMLLTPDPLLATNLLFSSRRTRNTFILFQGLRHAISGM